jgi:hypothetical protein
MGFRTIRVRAKKCNETHGMFRRPIYVTSSLRFKGSVGRNYFIDRSRGAMGLETL